MEDPRYPEVKRETEFDQSSYWGRVRHFANLTNMRFMLVGAAQVKRSQEMADQFKSGMLSPSIPVDAIVEARKMCMAVVHSDTKEPIPIPFRMSAQVPTNTILTVGLLVARTPREVILSQLFNQSFMVGLNYANRNASVQMSNTQLAGSFFVALSSAITAAVGLNTIVNRSRMSPSVKDIALRLVPFVAVACANFCNVAAMRSAEIRQGVSIFNNQAQEEQVGVSKRAGMLAVGQTIAVRIVSAIPVMVVPPLILRRLEAIPFVAARPKVSLALNAGLVGLAIMAFLPLTLSVFPQVNSVRTTFLEPEFHSLKDKDGRPLHEVFFNKGL